MSILKEASYPFPDVNLHFLGTIVQNYRIIRGKETEAFQTWIQKIEDAVAQQLVPALEKNNMLLPRSRYSDLEISDHFTLTKIANFNSLIALSQEHRTPIYALTPEQLRQTGVVLSQNQAKQEEFRQVFSDLADKIIGLTENSFYAVST
jgi:hypothetical protein